MPQLKELASGHVYTVASTPEWIGGIWECGDQRFVDHDKTLFEVVPGAVLAADLWYNCFTPMEAIAIKGSTDPLVKEFYFRLQQAIAAGRDIDTSTLSVQQGVGYLSTAPQQPAVTPPAPYIAPARVAPILAGILQ